MQEFTHIATITFESGDTYKLFAGPDKSPTGRLKNDYLLVGPGGSVYQGEHREVWLTLQNHALAELPAPEVDTFAGRLPEGVYAKPAADTEDEYIIRKPDRESSLIRQASHDTRSQVLGVTLQTGGTYYYQNVPRSTFWQLIKTWSPGSYYNRAIKNVYPRLDSKSPVTFL